MSSQWSGLLEGITRVPGVRGALVVSAEDGLVVAESSMGDVDGGAVAALAASLVVRLGRAVAALGHDAPRLVHLEAELGAVMATPAGSGLLLAAVADADANVGLLRLALRDAAQRVA
ncbi:MAG TPA: roadblock/LC7 domain-containing protein [Gemmatimonadales bacterium]